MTSKIIRCIMFLSIAVPNGTAAKEKKFVFDHVDESDASAQSKVNKTNLRPNDKSASKGGAFVDIFAATGQSNAWQPPKNDHWIDDIENSGKYFFGRGVEKVLLNSGKFSNPVVIVNGAPGKPISFWYDEILGGPSMLYEQQFFGNFMDQGVLGDMEVLFEKVRKEGKIPRFRGLFWFQGESDGTEPSQMDTSTEDYIVRWNGLITQLAADVGSDDFNFVMNTVGNSGERINYTLKQIVDNDDRGVIFDTQVPPYRTDPWDIHGYDHFAVGEANAQLFLDMFLM